MGELGFIDSYWYWRIRAESTIMDPENLPKKSYAQLCRDMGLTIVNTQAEHMLGIIELYEYLKSSPFIGPFGTIENPVLCPRSTLSALLAALAVLATVSTCRCGSAVVRASCTGVVNATRSS